jgi:hypothetical protein
MHKPLGAQAKHEDTLTASVASAWQAVCPKLAELANRHQCSQSHVRVASFSAFRASQSSAFCRPMNPEMCFWMQEPLGATAMLENGPKGFKTSTPQALCINVWQACSISLAS